MLRILAPPSRGFLQSQFPINHLFSRTTLLSCCAITQQTVGGGIPLGGLLSSLLHRLGCIPGPLFAGQAQRGNLPTLLRCCSLKASASRTAGGQIRQRSIQLRSVVPRAEPDTAGGAEAEQ